MLIPGWSVRTLQCGDAGSEGRCSKRTLHHRGPGTRWQSDEAVSGLWTMVFTDQTLPTQETTCLHQGSSAATYLQSRISIIRLLWMGDQDSWWVEECLETRTWHQWSSMMWEQVHLDMTHLWYDYSGPRSVDNSASVEDGEERSQHDGGVWQTDGGGRDGSTRLLSTRHGDFQWREVKISFRLIPFKQTSSLLELANNHFLF